MFLVGCSQILKTITLKANSKSESLKKLIIKFKINEIESHQKNGDQKPIK